MRFRSRRWSTAVAAVAVAAMVTGPAAAQEAEDPPPTEPATEPSAEPTAEPAPEPGVHPVDASAWDVEDGPDCLPAGGVDDPFETDPDSVVDAAALVLNGGGWGHSVGMSQFGANGAATLGCSTATILGTYYPGTSLATITPPRDAIAVHLLKRAYQPTTIRTTGLDFGGADLPWNACDLTGTVCETVAVQPAGSQWTVTPVSDGTFVLASSGVDPNTCPVPGDGVEPVAGCQWRGGDLETRLRMVHDGHVIRIVEASGRRVKWGFTEFDYSSKDGGVTYVTQYVTGADDGSVTALDRYLWGLGEVPSSWEPAALRTQAIAGRSYAEATVRTRETVFGRHADGGYIDRNECRCDLFATTVDQVYRGFDQEESETGAFKEAVTATAGVHLVYGEEPVAAFYSSSHGGWSEDVEHVWGTAIPYLPAVDATRWEQAASRSPERPWGNSRYRWTASFTAEDLAARFGLGSVESFTVVERGPGGRPTRLNGGGAEVVGTSPDGVPTTIRLSGESLRSKLSLFSALIHVVPSGDEPALARREVEITPACPEDEVPEDGYPDLQEGGTHEAAVDCVTWWSVSDPREDGTYGAGVAARRDEMAGALVDVLEQVGVELPADPQDHFTDDNSNPYEREINILAEMGLVLGRGDGKYAPSMTVQRGNMASFLVRMVELVVERTLDEADDPFADDDGNTHEQRIEQLFQAGIVAGYDDGSYRPLEPIAREQLASFLARTLALLVEEERAVLPSQRTTDEPAAEDQPAEPTGAARFATFARQFGVDLIEPSEFIEVIGFHESNHEGAQQMEPTGEGAPTVTMETRGRGTGSRTAADIVVEPDTPLWAPVSGTVVRAGTYTLYCEYSDDFVVIDPVGHPGWEVKLLHIDGVQVAPGDTVEAGVTMLAPRATVFPFASQVDDYSGPDNNPHVHMELIDPSIPNESSGGGC